MKIVKEQMKTMAVLIGDQPVEEVLYRPNTMLTVVEADGATVAYNTLTREMIELTPAEAALLQSDSVKAEASSADLIRKWYLVPKAHDDIQLADEVTAFVKVFEQKKAANTYTIFTTMDCNARCFYCYELGRPRRPMSEDTARDVAAYILRTHGDRKVHIGWFGGEPLYNTSVMDIISGALREAGVEFSANIISNGYLFDETNVRKAAEEWNIKRAQITLDGTEEVYNRAKAFIYKDGRSAFKVVTDNIERLLQKDIYVSVRMNMGVHNKDDLYKLVDFLAERFAGQKKLTAYAHLLFQDENGDMSEAEKYKQAEDLIALMDYCEKKGLSSPANLQSGFRFNACMADSPTAYTITPDGHLGKCEHFSEDEFVGDIYKGVTDPETERSFAERSNCAALCKGCSAYPVCVKLKKCPDEADAPCNAAKRLLQENTLRRSVIGTYRKLKNKEKEAKNA